MTNLHIFRKELLFRLNPATNIKDAYKMLFVNKYDGKRFSSVFTIVNCSVLVVLLLVLCYPICFLLDLIFTIANAELAIVQKLNMSSWKRRDPEGYEKYLKVQQQKTQEKKEDNSYVYKV